MDWALVTAAVVALGLIAYAIFGGADFGGGVWHALATGPRAREQQAAMFHAIGPVWETNHVWLILVIVTLFVGFPAAFGYIFTALLVPLVIAVTGIMFRGAAFGFRHFGGEHGLPATGSVFSMASTVTPLAFGMVLGAVSGGGIAIEHGRVASGLWSPWLQPLPIAAGLIAVAICGFLAAYYILPRTQGKLQEDFRTRALVANVVLGALSLAALPIAYWDAAPFWGQLTQPHVLVVIGLAMASGLFSLLVAWFRWYRLAAVAAAATVVLIIGGWSLAQYPYLIIPSVRIADVAASEAMLRAFNLALPAGAVLLIPSLILLYRLFGAETVGQGQDRHQ